MVNNDELNRSRIPGGPWQQRQVESRPLAADTAVQPVSGGLASLAATQQVSVRILKASTQEHGCRLTFSTAMVWSWRQT